MHSKILIPSVYLDRVHARFQSCHIMHSSMRTPPPLHLIILLIPSPPSSPSNRFTLQSVSLPLLPLIRLCILKGKPTGPLIHARLPANLAIAASKQDAPQRHRAEEHAAYAAQSERKHARLRPQPVAVERRCRVEQRCDGQRGECVRCFGVSVFRGDAWEVSVM